MTAALVVALVTACGGPGQTTTLTARVVAVGIPDAGTVSVVGRFLPGGPIRDKPQLAAFTEPGKVLDAGRVLVGSSSNFGAAKATYADLAGSILSIDPSAPDVIVV